MAGNSNQIEIKLKFLTERLDSIQAGVKQLEGLKKEALSLGNVLSTTLTVNTIQAGISTVVSAFDELKRTIDMGGALSDLSARTGQTVQDLVVLQQAFQNAGIGAQATGTMLNLLQKALTGVNEEGEPTSKAFARLGVSLETLKAQSAVGQIETLTAAFAQITDPAERTRAAMELFGRSGGQMLAVLSDASALGVARQQVGGLAETMQQNAAAFDKLGDSWEAIGLRMTQLFAGVAEVVAPMLQKIADEANAVDFTQMGKQVGELVLALTDLLKLVAPVAAAMGTAFALEKVLAGLSAFAGRVSASTTALAAETAALTANTAAQAANAAARAAGGAGTGAAWGRSAGPVATRSFGAPYSREAYDSARRMGMPAQQALEAARRAMWQAGQEAGKAAPLWTRLGGALQGGLGKAAAGLEKLIGGLFTLPNILAMVVAKLAVDFMIDQAKKLAAERTAGGPTDEVDMAKADEMRTARTAQYEGLAERVKGVRTEEERDALLEEISAIAEADRKAIVTSKAAGEPRTAQNTVLKNNVDNMDVLAGILQRKEGLPTQAQADFDAGVEARRKELFEAEQAARARRAGAKKMFAETQAEDARKDLSPEELAKDMAARRAKLIELSNAEGPSEEDKTAALQEANRLLEEELNLRRQIKQEEEDKAAARKEMQDRLELEEAAGDPQRLAAVKWKQDYEQILAEAQKNGMGDDAFAVAIRGANAGDGTRGEGDVFSAARSLGGARGEVYEAQNRALSLAAKQAELLQRLVDKQPVVIDTTGRFS